MDGFVFSVPFLAHLLIGFYFAFFGFWNIYHWYTILEVMAQKGIPHPYLLLSAGIAWQIVAGTMIMFSIEVKVAAFLLIPFTIIAVLMFHPFWKFKGEHRILNLNIFLANMTVGLGSLLLLINESLNLA